MTSLSGYKSYLAAAGFFLLACVLAGKGQYEQAVQVGLAALAVLGLRHAISNSGVK